MLYMLYSERNAVNAVFLYRLCNYIVWAEKFSQNLKTKFDMMSDR